VSDPVQATVENGHKGKNQRSHGELRASTITDSLTLNAMLAHSASESKPSG